MCLREVSHWSHCQLITLHSIIIGTVGAVAGSRKFVTHHMFAIVLFLFVGLLGAAVNIYIVTKIVFGKYRRTCFDQGKKKMKSSYQSLLAALAITCLAEGLSWPMTGFLYLDKYNFYKVLKTWDNFSRDNHSTIKVNIILICSTVKMISL